MKYLEVKLEGNKSILVDESVEIKVGDYCIYTPFGIGQIKNINDELWFITIPVKNRGSLTQRLYQCKDECKKLVATINHSINLDVPMVVIEDEVEKIALNMIIDISKKQFLSLGTLANIGEGIILGYKAAQQKGVYSEEVIISNFQEKYYEFINSGGLNGSSSEWIDHSKLVPWFKNYIQSLKQEYIELEMEEYVAEMPNIHHKLYKIKITKNKDGQLIAYIKE